MNNSVGSKKLRVALLVYKEVIAETVYDHINSFLNFSKNKVEIHDVSNMRNLDITRIMTSDVIVIHYTTSLLSDDRLPLKLRLLIKEFNNIKVLYIQDEYRQVNRIHSALNFLEIDILFTCVPTEEIEKVYPTEKLPFLKHKMNVLTGYVPEKLKKAFNSRLSYSERKLDVVYRARKISAQYGRLGQDKWTIVEKFSADAEKYNLKINLSYLEKDRLYGRKWIEFLRNSKAALGVESGASVFDFTGNIKRNVETYEAYNPNASYEEVEAMFFPGQDGKIYMNQISPRCFECAAVGTLMILYEGNYSGILKPWRHYIPLKKDHSNIEEVVKALKDPVLWENIVNQAYNEIALNEEYSYKVMINLFDEAVAAVDKKGYVFIPQYETNKNSHVLRFLAKSMHKIVKKTKILRLVRKIKLKIDDLSVFIAHTLKMLQFAINNSIYISVGDFLKIIQLSKIMTKNKYSNLDKIFMEVCIIDKCLNKQLKGSPFLINYKDDVLTVKFSEAEKNTAGFLERMLRLNTVLTKSRQIKINLPETMFLSENLSGMNLDAIRGY